MKNQCGANVRYVNVHQKCRVWIFRYWYDMSIRNVLFTTGTIAKINKDIKVSTNVRYLRS